MEGLREEKAVSACRARRGRPGLAIAVAGGLALGGAASDARADDQAEAVKLFDKGRSLMQNAATLGEACRTLEESLKLWDRGDTVLNLALCHRRQGKTATAWAEFDRALSHGTKVGFPEAVQEATRQRDELAAILSRLTVTVPPATAALEGLTVEVDDHPLSRERYNTAFVIDPGPVRVRARAKGHKPLLVQVEIGANKDDKNVLVVLEVEPPGSRPPPPPPPPLPIARPPRPVWPWVVGGAGALLGVAAVGSEIVSVRAHGELNAQCGPARQSCPSGYDFHAARSRELLGFRLFVGLGTVGVLALGAAGAGFGLSARAPQGPGTSLVVSLTSIAVQSTF
jgi:hypothetical protein